MSASAKPQPRILRAIPWLLVVLLVALGIVGCPKPSGEDGEPQEAEAQEGAPSGDGEVSEGAASDEGEGEGESALADGEEEGEGASGEGAGEEGESAAEGEVVEGETAPEGEEGERSPYAFDGTMPRVVLDAYLARSITMSDILLDWQQPLQAEHLRFIENTGAKFLGRAVVVWGNESDVPQFEETLVARVAAIHAVDPEIMVQGGIFEFVSRNVEALAIPAWVFEAMGDPVEVRNFRFDEMGFSCFPPQNYGGTDVDATVPDVARPETQRWYLYQAGVFINAGVEAIHLGQFQWTAECSEGYVEADALVGYIRAHAAAHARRHYVVLDAHTHGMARDGRLLLDFHSYPLRIKEGDSYSEGTLEAGFLDSIYGQSLGGVSPSGETYVHAPFLVEFDHGYAGDDPGGDCEDPVCVWGYDELSWMGYLAEAERNAWIRYAWDWLRENDPNGWLEMVGSRDLLGISYHGSDWYYAHTFDAENMAYGFNQEETIKAVWAEHGNAL